MNARLYCLLCVLALPLSLFATAQEKPKQDKKKTTKSNQIEYRGKKLTPDKFRRAAVRTKYAALAADDNKKVGYAVTIEGQIEEIADSHWIILMEKTRNEMGKVKIDLANVGKTKARVGSKVKIAGVQTEGMTGESPPVVAAYLYEYIIPIEWKYQFRPIDRSVTVPDFFYVDGTVKNTGKTLVSSVTLDSILALPSQSIVELDGSVVVTDIKPGATKTFTIQFRNDLRWSFVKTSPLPNCDMILSDYQMAE